MSFGDLRGILQYVPQFQDKTFVIAIDGAVVSSEGFSNLLLDIAVLHSLSVKIVLVHGASAQIRDLAKQRGVTLSSDDGCGITDQPTFDVSLDAITSLNFEILRQLAGVRLRAASVNAIHGHSEGVVKGVDQQLTGRVSWVDDEALKVMLDSRIIPVLSPTAITSTGNTLRVNSDAVGRKVASTLKADKLIFLCGESVPMLSEGRRHFAVAVGDAEKLAEELNEHWATRVNHARRACENGVSRAHFLNGLESDALLAEVFSNEGVGLMVFADHYLRVRPLEGKDVPDLLSMIRNSVADDALLNRSATEIFERIDDYRVIEVDGNLVGSVALHQYGDEDVAELACLYVKRDHENQGYARRLVDYAMKMAKEAKVQRVVALTTRAKDYFAGTLGFTEGSMADLPEERRSKLEASGRHSLVMVKSLQGE